MSNQPGPPPGDRPEPDVLTAEMARMVAGVEAAMAAYQAGQIDEVQLQQQCLAAGTARVGNGMLIWDWTTGTLYGYDGFRLSQLYQNDQ